MEGKLLRNSYLNDGSSRLNLISRFLYKSNKQTKVKLLKQFDKWTYNSWSSTVNNRMPWLGQRKGILTTSGSDDYAWWGTIVSDNVEYDPAPWISSQMKEPGVIWYWINEDDCSPDRVPGNII